MATVNELEQRIASLEAEIAILRAQMPIPGSYPVMVPYYPGTWPQRPYEIRSEV